VIPHAIDAVGRSESDPETELEDFLQSIRHQDSHTTHIFVPSIDTTISLRGAKDYNPLVHNFEQRVITHILRADNFEQLRAQTLRALDSNRLPLAREQKDYLKSFISLSNPALF
jgi:peroxiredoxin